MYPPTAIADSGPTFCADDAVPRMVLTRPRVSSASTTPASGLEKRARRAAAPRPRPRFGEAGAGQRRAQPPDVAEDGSQHQTGRDRGGQLDDDVAGHPAPR